MSSERPWIPRASLSRALPWVLDKLGRGHALRPRPAALRGGRGLASPRRCSPSARRARIASLGARRRLPPGGPRGEEPWRGRPRPARRARGSRSARRSTSPRGPRRSASSKFPRRAKSLARTRRQEICASASSGTVSALGRPSIGQPQGLLVASLYEERVGEPRPETRKVPRAAPPLECLARRAHRPLGGDSVSRQQLDVALLNGEAADEDAFEAELLDRAPSPARSGRGRHRTVPASPRASRASAEGQPRGAGSSSCAERISSTRSRARSAGVGPSRMPSSTYSRLRAS